MRKRCLHQGPARRLERYSRPLRQRRGNRRHARCLYFQPSHAVYRGPVNARNGQADRPRLHLGLAQVALFLVGRIDAIGEANTGLPILATLQKITGILELRMSVLTGFLWRH
jgi:hypothetical protein